MRGKGHNLKIWEIQNRITPAYAGKSIEHLLGQGIIQDHPRLCGEKTEKMLEVLSILGSPPPMRGKGGGIPPHVHNLKDHPRLCGEKIRHSHFSLTLSGSPPPMRGKVAPSTPKRKIMRITPAYAGKSTQILWNCFLDQDHPRLCGEKQ